MRILCRVTRQTPSSPPERVAPPGGQRSSHVLSRHRAERQLGFLVCWEAGSFHPCHSEKPRMLSSLPEATHGAREAGTVVLFTRPLVPWRWWPGRLEPRGGRPWSCSLTAEAGAVQPLVPRPGPAQVPHLPSLRAPKAGLGRVDEGSRVSTLPPQAGMGQSWEAEPGPLAPRPVPGPVLSAMAQDRSHPSSVSISRVVSPSLCVDSAQKSTGPFGSHVCVSRKVICARHLG